jgi:hypothetical protein
MSIYFNKLVYFLTILLIFSCKYCKSSLSINVLFQIQIVTVKYLMERLRLKETAQSLNCYVLIYEQFEDILPCNLIENENTC